jgi:hypothetical protein
MILRVDGDAGSLSHDPVVRQRFRPGGVNLELRHVVGKGRRNGQRANEKRRNNFHEFLPDAGGSNGIAPMLRLQ